MNTKTMQMRMKARLTSFFTRFLDLTCEYLQKENTCLTILVVFERSNVLADLYISPDSPEYLHVEEDEGESGYDTGDHQPGPVYVEPGFRQSEN